MTIKVQVFRWHLRRVLRHQRLQLVRVTIRATWRSIKEKLTIILVRVIYQRHYRDGQVIWTIILLMLRIVWVSLWILRVLLVLLIVENLRRLLLSIHQTLILLRRIYLKILSQILNSLINRVKLLLGLSFRTHCLLFIVWMLFRLAIIPVTYPILIKSACIISSCLNDIVWRTLDVLLRKSVLRDIGLIQALHWAMSCAC